MDLQDIFRDSDDELDAPAFLSRNPTVLYSSENNYNLPSVSTSQSTVVQPPQVPVITQPVAIYPHPSQVPVAILPPPFSRPVAIIRPSVQETLAVSAILDLDSSDRAQPQDNQTVFDDGKLDDEVIEVDDDFVQDKDDIVEVTETVPPIKNDPLAISTIDDVILTNDAVNLLKSKTAKTSAIFTKLLSISGVNALKLKVVSLRPFCQRNDIGTVRYKHTKEDPTINSGPIGSSPPVESLDM